MKLKQTFLLPSLLALASCLTPIAHAHHGQSFIVVEDTQCACCENFVFLSNFEWEKGAEGSESGLSPMVLFGLTKRLSFSVEADFRDEVESDWAYSSVTPSLHVLLTPPDCSFPIRLGLSAGYQFGTGEDFEDGPSIHAHGVDAFVGRFIMEGNLTDDLTAVVNILNVAGPGTAWGYAAGLRQKLCAQVSVGIEAIGDFKNQGWEEMVGAVYYQPVSGLTLKLGAGFGLNDETPDFTLRTGFVWRF
jgi:hypothetical protein